MERYTKKDKDGRYYIEGVNGKLESDIKGHVYGKAIDRFAELEASDVVEVVRCKDCKFVSCVYPDGLINCSRESKIGCGSVFRKATDFCSYGERKNDG